MVPDLAAITRASLVQMNVIFQRTKTRELVFRGDASVSASAPGSLTSTLGLGLESESMPNSGIGTGATNGTNLNDAMTEMAGDMAFMTTTKLFSFCPHHDNS